MRGFMVFAHLDHAAAAKQKGLSMPYSTVVVFGNPKIGTPGFIKVPESAIDLPLKALVWEDQDGKVFLSYNTGTYLLKTLYPRHGRSAPQKLVNIIDGNLAKIAAETTK